MNVIDFTKYKKKKLPTSDENWSEQKKHEFAKFCEERDLFYSLDIILSKIKDL